MNETALTSQITMSKLSESITIETGKMILNMGDEVIEINGNLSLSWAPSPGINFEGEIISKEINTDEHVFKREDIIISSENGRSGEARITSFTHGNHEYIKGKIIKELFEGEKDCEYALLSIVNLSEYHGRFITKNKRQFNGRIILSYANYKITIDKNLSDQDLYRELDATGGYYITNTAKIEKTDGGNINLDEVNKTIENLTWFLSFMTGRQVGVCAIHGYKNDVIVSETIQAPIITSWKVSRNWFSQYIKIDEVEDMFPSFMELLNKEPWEKVLKTLLSWYFDGIDATYSEKGIVATQIALEMLAWTLVVEEKKIILGDIFDNRLRASDKLRVLMYELSIPVEIPSESLKQSFAKYEDGLYLFSDYRNDIVHAKKKSIFNNLTVNDRVNLAELGKRYLELSLLSLCGYKGKYHNFLKEVEWYAQTVEDVPWIRK